MVIFNQTFVAEKQIYFPTNWETGKTALQLHEQWKSTITYLIFSNAVQVIVSSCWILIAVIIVIAAKQIKRLNDLSWSSRQKRDNQKYLKDSFKIGLVVLSVIWLSSTVVFLFKDEWNRWAFLKGLLFLLLAYVTRFGYKKIKEYSSRIKKSQIRNQEYDRVDSASRTE